MKKKEINKGKKQLSIKKKLLYSIIPLLAILLTAEIGLRIIGFNYDSTYRFMRFGFPDEDSLHEVYEPDPVTLWKLVPSYNFGAKIPGINSLGFRGPETNVSKPDGIKRIICMGDSVTFGAPLKSYPGELADILGKDSGYEVINAGIPGFSSWQGVKLLEHRILNMEPDIIIIAYGWNDGWLAFGHSDSEQRVAPKAYSSAERTLRKTKTYQAMNMTVNALRKRMLSPAQKHLRVPVDEFQKNIKAIITKTRSMNAVPVLMTLPSAVSLGKMPDFFYYNGLIEGDPKEPAELGLEKIRNIHDKYNKVIRDLAASEDCLIIDIDKKFSSHDLSRLFNRPEKDIIHPNDAGYALMAGMAYDILKELIEGEQGGKNE